MGWTPCLPEKLTTSVGGGADFLGVRGAILDGETALHGRVGTWEMLHRVWARATGREGHEWMD